MHSDTVQALVDAERGVVTAAAGCGKTEAIVQAVKVLGPKGRQLVLTHTHAGVAALKRRMEKRQVPPSHYRIETIASWSLRYAVHYPKLSGLSSSTQPTGAGWNATYDAAQRLMDTPALRRVVQSSYAGMFVDEYQDCTLKHHRLVLALSTILPCRIVGDPLQGIFDFKDPIVNWPTDVLPNFLTLPPLEIPWRWEKNPALGTRITDIRNAISLSDKVDLRVGPIRWRQLPAAAGARLATQRAECLIAARKTGSVVALRKWARDCHSVGEGLSGAFTCMEEMDCNDLLKHAARIEAGDGFHRVRAVIEFAQLCMTGIAAPLKPFREAAQADKLPTVRQQQKLPNVSEAVRRLVDPTAGLTSVGPLLDAIGSIPTRRVYRRELWTEMRRAVEAHGAGTAGTLREIAWGLRNRSRHRGRQIDKRTLSRTLLVKGLEFSHCVVLDAGELDKKNFYVAITRPQDSLVICSAQPFYL